MNIKIISASAGTGKTHRLTEILGRKIREGRVNPKKNKSRHHTGLE